MQISRISSKLSMKELSYIIEGLDAVAIRPDAIESLDELDLAYHLAKSSFKKKKNIARKMKYEFLLWLACTRDIENAIKKTSPTDEENFILITFTGQKNIIEKMMGKKTALELNKKGNAIRLENISLSRTIS